MPSCMTRTQIRTKTSIDPSSSFSQCHHCWFQVSQPPFIQFPPTHSPIHPSMATFIIITPHAYIIFTPPLSPISLSLSLPVLYKYVMVFSQFSSLTLLTPRAEKRLKRKEQKQKMCVSASRWRWNSSIPSYSPIFRCPVKKCKVRVRLPSRRSSSEENAASGREMELQNLKLYLENRCMIEENERLRKRALVLDQENQALLSEFKKKFSHPNDNNIWWSPPSDTKGGVSSLSLSSPSFVYFTGDTIRDLMILLTSVGVWISWERSKVLMR